MEPSDPTESATPDNKVDNTDREENKDRKSLTVTQARETNVSIPNSEDHPSEFETEPEKDPKGLTEKPQEFQTHSETPIQPPSDPDSDKDIIELKSASVNNAPLTEEYVPPPLTHIGTSLKELGLVNNESNAGIRHHCNEELPPIPDKATPETAPTSSPQEYEPTHVNNAVALAHPSPPEEYVPPPLTHIGTSLKELGLLNNESNAGMRHHCNEELPPIPDKATPETAPTSSPQEYEPTQVNNAVAMAHPSPPEEYVPPPLTHIGTSLKELGLMNNESNAGMRHQCNEELPPIPDKVTPETAPTSFPQDYERSKYPESSQDPTPNERYAAEEHESSGRPDLTPDDLMKTLKYTKRFDEVFKIQNPESEPEEQEIDEEIKKDATHSEICEIILGNPEKEQFKAVGRQLLTLGKTLLDDLALLDKYAPKEAEVQLCLASKDAQGTESPFRIGEQQNELDEDFETGHHLQENAENKMGVENTNNRQGLTSTERVSAENAASASMEARNRIQTLERQFLEIDEQVGQLVTAVLKRNTEMSNQLYKSDARLRHLEKLMNKIQFESKLQMHMGCLDNPGSGTDSPEDEA